MAFINKLRTYNNRIITLNEININQDEEIDLRDQLGSLQDLRRQIDSLNSKISFFLRYDITINLDTEKFRKAVNYVKILTKNFETHSNSESLKNGSTLRNLKVLVRDLNEEIPINLESSWNVFIQSCGILDTPNTIKQKMEPTDINKDHLKTYEENYKLYTIFIKVPYERDNPIDQIKEIITNLKNIYKQISLIDNDEIQEFIEKSQSINGANLDLFTDNIRNWIYKNKLEDKYFVKKIND